MFIGIDVGGTFTDAVLTDGKTVIKKCKALTRHNNLISSLLEALDNVIQGQDINQIQRVVLSTTLITNIIAEKKYPPVALVLMPGPGLAYNDYSFGTLTHFVKGAIDYRGREIVPIEPKEIVMAGADIITKGYKELAVVGKFCNRNSCHELQAKETLEKHFPGINIGTGHSVSSQLNFPRRVATTMLTAATRAVFTDFCENVLQSLNKRKISAQTFILKADGGMLPLSYALEAPVETIFSGPAASTLGAMSLSPKHQTSVVVDIGGTTTDLSLILSGEPLMASKGAEVDGFLTQVRSFSVKSVPFGGDSTIVVKDRQISILPSRSGPAYCFGGHDPTPTDALRFLNRVYIGDSGRAVEIMTKLGQKVGKTPQETAEDIISQSCQTIIQAIEQMFTSWEQEPAYRIWEVVQKSIIRPNNIIGVGGAAGGLISDVAKQMDCQAIIPENCEVANALGAAVAQPTITVNLRIDTERGYYTVLQDGTTGNIPKGSGFTEEKALELARDCLYRRAENLGIKSFIKKIETVSIEVFNMVRDWTTTGRIYDICVQTPQEILFYLGQEGAPDEE